MSQQDVNLEEELARTRLSRRVMHRLGKYLWPYRWPIGLALAAEVVWVWSMGQNSVLIQRGLNSLFEKGDYNGLVWAALLFLFNGIFRTLLVMFELRMCYRSGVHFLNDLRAELFHHIQKLSMRYFDRTKEGRIISRVDRDVDSLEPTLVWGPLVLVSQFFSVIEASRLMCGYSWKLWLAVASVLPILSVASWYFQKKGMAAYRKLRESLSRVTAFLAETVNGARVLQGFSRQKFNQGQFEGVVDDHRGNVVRAAVVWNAYLPVISTCYAIGVIVTLGYGGLLIMRGELLVSELVAYLTLLGLFFWPIEGFAELYNQSLSAASAAERIFLLLDTEPEIRDEEHAEDWTNPRGHLKFEHVNFAYDQNKRDDWALRDIDFEVSPGQTLALVGATGAGKSSIVNLTARFYDTLEGRILIDGKDIRRLKLESLHQHMAIVMQDNFLFNGTVMENLLYGNPNAKPEDALQAARDLGSFSIISALENGFETMVKERGLGLSQGERQLICFTRALIANPAILILDEATSSVDTATENVIQKALTKLCKNRTTMIVAHRLSTIRNADLILVVQGGKIAERGNHGELMTKEGTYYDLYQNYIRKGAVV